MKKRLNQNTKLIFCTVIILLICMVSVNVGMDSVTGQFTWKPSFKWFSRNTPMNRITPTDKVVKVQDTDLDKNIPADSILVKKELNCNAAKNKIINLVAGISYKNYKDGIKVYQYPELLEKYNIVESYHITPFRILEEPTCLFVVDISPYAMFAHPVEYIYVNPETLKQEKEYAMWWPKVNGISWPLPDEDKIYEKDIVVKTTSTTTPVQQKPSGFVRFFRIFSPFGKTVLDVTGLIPIEPSQLTPLKAPIEVEVKEVKTIEHKVPKLTDDSECYECPNKFTCEGDKYALIVNGVTKKQRGWRRALKEEEHSFSELSKIVPKENLIRISPDENVKLKFTQELNKLKDKLKPNDKLFIFITGHGVSGITGDTLIREKVDLTLQQIDLERTLKESDLSDQSRSVLRKSLDEKKKQIEETKKEIEQIKKGFGETYHIIELGDDLLNSVELYFLLGKFNKDVSITMFMATCFGGGSLDQLKNLEAVKQIILSSNRYYSGFSYYEKEYWDDISKLAPLYKDKKINWFDLWSFARYSAQEDILFYSILATNPASPTMYDKNCEFNFEYSSKFSSKLNLIGNPPEKIFEFIEKTGGFDINSLVIHNTGSHKINDVIVCYNGKILNKLEKEVLFPSDWNVLKISDKCIKFYTDKNPINPGEFKEFSIKSIKLTTTVANVKIPDINKEKFTESDDQARPSRISRICISWDEGGEHKELCKCPNRGSFRFYESLKQKKSNPKICEVVIGITKPIVIEKVSLPKDTTISPEYYIPSEEQCKVTKEYCQGKNGKLKNKPYPSNYGDPIKITRYSCDANKNCVLKKAFEDCKTIVSGKVDFGRCVPTADGAICLYDDKADEIWKKAAAKEGDTSQF